MPKVGAVVVRAFREAIPPTIYFAAVFHAVQIAKAAFLADHGLAHLPELSEPCKEALFETWLHQ